MLVLVDEKEVEMNTTQRVIYLIERYEHKLVEVEGMARSLIEANRELDEKIIKTFGKMPKWLAELKREEEERRSDWRGEDGGDSYAKAK